MPKNVAGFVGAGVSLLLLMAAIIVGIRALAEGRWIVVIVAILATWLIGFVGAIFAVQILALVQFTTVFYWLGDVVVGVHGVRTDQTGVWIGAVVGFFVIPTVGGMIMTFRQGMERALMAHALQNQD